MKTTLTENDPAENLMPEESMQIINAMINTSKNKLADDGFLYIFWGWLVCLSALINFVCIKLNIEYGYYVWPVLMPLGGIFSGIYASRQNKKAKVKTYVNTYLSYVWIIFCIALIITLFTMSFNGFKQTYFFLMLLYGIATFISGGLLNFKPLLVGAIFSFACAVASVFFGDVEQLLWLSLALLFSYIIPGHLLRAKFKSEKNA